jgi:hypothetical protein
MATGPNRATNLRDLGFAVGCFALMPISAYTVRFWPISEQDGEAVVLALFLPLRVVMWGVFGLVDLLGPQGRAEPASMYLPRWAGWSLVVLSCLVLLALLFGVARGAMWWAGRRRIRGHQAQV